MKKLLAGVVVAVAALGFAAGAMTNLEVVQKMAAALGISTTGSISDILNRMVASGKVSSSWLTKLSNGTAVMSVDDFVLFVADVRNGPAPVPATVEAAKTQLTTQGVDVAKITSNPNVDLDDIKIAVAPGIRVANVNDPITPVGP